MSGFPLHHSFVFDPCYNIAISVESFSMKKVESAVLSHKKNFKESSMDRFQIIFQSISLKSACKSIRFAEAHMFSCHKHQK